MGRGPYGMTAPSSAKIISPVTAWVTPTASFGRSCPTSCSRTRYRASLPGCSTASRNAGTSVLDAPATTSPPADACTALEDSLRAHATTVRIAHDRTALLSRYYTGMSLNGVADGPMCLSGDTHCGWRPLALRGGVQPAGGPCHHSTVHRMADGRPPNLAGITGWFTTSGALSLRSISRSYNFPRISLVTPPSARN